MDLIKSFNQISKKDTEIAGGKGASLGEMTKAGIPVPDGFVILSSTFERFITETKLHSEIDDLLKKVNTKKIKNVEDASDKIRELIISKDIPEDIKKEILKNYKKLNSKFVAVRSSATAEDSAEVAWAGQLDSFLNTKAEKLLENVKKCWASLFTPRAIFYRFEKGLQKEKISVAVVVQKMVNAEKSGIAFSVHPVTQVENEIVIEAGFGLGEAIVSGAVTPDNYVVGKNKINILTININAQSKALYKKVSGGNKWEKLGDKGKKQVLSKLEIQKLSRMIVKIEKHYGFPCDIEWAQENGKFFIIQSRPITTLEKNETKQYRAVFTRPFSVVRMEFETKGEFLGIKKLTADKYFFKPFFVYSKSKGVTAYYNFSSDEENVKFIIEYLNKKVVYLKKELIKIKKTCAFLEKLLQGKNLVNPQKIFDALVEIQPFSSLGNLVGHLPFASKALLKLFKSYRYDYDGLTYRAEKYLLEQGGKKLQKKFQSYVNTLSFAELFDGKKINNLEKRQKGFIFHMDELTTKDLNDFLNEHAYYIYEESVNKKNELRGSSTYRGIVKGIVRKIYIAKDVRKFKKGDILVSPMTIPDFVPAMKVAAAFVTDEGGITCHAAIIAREMKKPCVIGTKNATKILNDGDLVEVDANQGIVKILKRKNKPRK